MRRGAVLVLVAACAACAPAPSPGVFRRALGADPTSLDPARATGEVEGILVANLYSNLVMLAADGGIVGDLAETWTVSADGRTWRFRLRPGARFHDRRPVEAEDVAYSFRRLVDPAEASPRAWVLEGMEEVVAEGPLVVRVRLAAPSPSFLARLAMPNAAVVPRGAGRELGEAPIGSGPFRLVEWRHDDRLHLDRFEAHHLGPPSILGIEYRIVREPSTAESLLRAGEVDAIEAPEGRLAALRADPSIRLIERDLLGVYFVALHVGRIPDTAVRRAMVLAVDRAAILAALREGRGSVASGAIPPGLPGHDPDRAPLPFDPAAARRVIEEAGWKGRRLEFLRGTAREAVEIVDAIAAYLREAGLAVEVVPLERAALRKRQNDGDFDLTYMNWIADYPEGENFLVPLFHGRHVGPGGNRSRLADPALDRAMDAATALVDPAARAAAYREIDGRLRDAAPWIHLWYPRQVVAVGRRVERFVLPSVYYAEKGMGITLRDG